LLWWLARALKSPPAAGHTWAGGIAGCDPLKYVVTALELGEIRFFELEAHSLIEARATAIRELRQSMKAGQVVDVQLVSTDTQRRRLSH
jgi:hypothetical protein